MLKAQIHALYHCKSTFAFVLKENGGAKKSRFIVSNRHNQLN